jgi:hypothetical protein
MVLLIAAMCLLSLVIMAFWMIVPFFYRLHKNLKQYHPLVFRLVGYNDRYLADERKWVFHGRSYVVLIGVLVGVILVSLILAIGGIR